MPEQYQFDYLSLGVGVLGASTPFQHYLKSAGSISFFSGSNF